MHSYNYNTGKLCAEKDNIIYDIDIRLPVTCVFGDSGSGKTLLCEIIEDDLNISPSAKTESNVLLLDYRSRESVINEAIEAENKLVLIDNADILFRSFPQLLKQVSGIGKKSHYLVFSREAELNLTPYNYAVLEHTDRKFWLEYVAS
jgi:ABC-type glutathione transport system ATPase component